MRFILIATLIAAGLFSCNSQKTSGSLTCFKGRLEVKGICSNYTISVVEGSMDTTKLVAKWMDETTNKSYSNVFGLGSPCSFPDSLKAGDEFYFVIDTVRQNCAVCMAYYPKPSRALSIKVLSKSCN